MSLTSNLFILFVFITVVLLYSALQDPNGLCFLWQVMFYYIYSGPRYVYFYLIFHVVQLSVRTADRKKFAENKDENGKTGNKNCRKRF